MPLRSLLILFATVFFLSAFSVFSQTVSIEPDATGIRSIYAGGSHGLPWTGAYGWQSQNNIYMESFGDESYISFTVNWDPQQWIFLQAEKGIDLPAGSQITLNKSRLAVGSLGITIKSPQVVREGSINIVTLQLYTPQDPSTLGRGMPITFSSDPTLQLVRGANGEELSAIYLNSPTQVFFFDPDTSFSMGGGSVLPGQLILVPFIMSEIFSPFTGQTTFQFSIEWDNTRFSFANASVGDGAPPGLTLELDTTQLSEGRLGVIIAGTSPLPPGSFQSLTIANVALTASPQVENGFYPVFFTNSPIPYSVLNAQGKPAASSSRFPAFVRIGTTTTVNGVVRRPTGQPMANTTVQLSELGNIRFTAVTNSFGNFTFPAVPFGKSYTIRVVSKRFRFPATPIFVSSATDVELRGLE